MFQSAGTRTFTGKDLGASSFEDILYKSNPFLSILITGYSGHGEKYLSSFQ